MIEEMRQRLYIHIYRKEKRHGETLGVYGRNMDTLGSSMATAVSTWGARELPVATTVPSRLTMYGI